MCWAFGPTHFSQFDCAISAPRILSGFHWPTWGSGLLHLWHRRKPLQVPWVAGPPDDVRLRRREHAVALLSYLLLHTGSNNLPKPHSPPNPPKISQNNPTTGLGEFGLVSVCFLRNLCGFETLGFQFSRLGPFRPQLRCCIDGQPYRQSIFAKPYLMLRNSASGPEIGLPGRISAES